MKRLIFLAFLFGCQTVESKQPEPMEPEEASPTDDDVQPKLVDCPGTQIELREGAEWLPEDNKVLIRAMNRCGELYPGSPCVKKFIKLGARDNVRYRVVCGGKNGSDKQGTNEREMDFL